MASKPAVVASCEDAPVVPPPATVIVEHERKPVLYTPDGKALIRKVGF